MEFSPVNRFLRTLQLGESSPPTAIDSWFASTADEVFPSHVVSDWVGNGTHDFSSSSTGLSSVFDSQKQHPQMLLGGLGRDIETSWNLDFDTDAHLVDPIQRLQTKELYDDAVIDEDGNGAGIMRCFLHDRVSRSLKRKRLDIDFVKRFVVDKIVIGAIVRNVCQYKKKVDRDIFELRLNGKERVLYSRSPTAVLLLHIVWDHKLDLPIKRAQKEMDVMHHWMRTKGLASEEPFVLVDIVSGRLRPLYRISLEISDLLQMNIGANDPSESFCRYCEMNCDGSEKGKALYSPSLLDLVLSPEQRSAYEHVVAKGFLGALNLKSQDIDVRGVPSADLNVDEDSMPISITRDVMEEAPSSGHQPCELSNCEECHHKPDTCRKGLRSAIHCVIIQGSAGSGKTTTVLRGGLGRAERGDDVVIIAVTRLLADSIGEDLRASSNYANLCSSVRLIDRHKLRLSIMHGLGSICGINNDENDLLDVSDVRVWLEKLPMAMTKRVERGEREALAHWLLSGHREGFNSGAYKEFSLLYEDWKAQTGKRDEGDIWQIFHAVLKVLHQSGEACKLQQYAGPCDVLLLDEAQLYPAETIFACILMWFQPTKIIVLGMDTKQAIYLGSSRRRDLLSVTRCLCDVIGWADVIQKKYSLTTNFRLPAKLVALSNAMISTLRHTLPKVFDDYLLDECLESRAGDTAHTPVSEQERNGSCQGRAMLFIQSKTTHPFVSQGYNYTGIDGVSSPSSHAFLPSMESSLGTMATSVRHYPAMLVTGAAATKLKRLLSEKLISSPLVALRFANLNLLTEETRDVSSRVIEDILPSIHFQQCSGLEVCVPVVVDCLLSSYLNIICPRRIFSSVLRGQNLETHELNMISCALCSAYTVLTRCRGPLVWIETGKDVDAHPFLALVKDKLRRSELTIDILSNPDCVDDALLDSIFSPTTADSEDMATAWETTLKSLLKNLKHDFWNCVTDFKRHARDTPFSILCRNESYISFSRSSSAVAKILGIIGQPNVKYIKQSIECLHILLTWIEGNWAVGSKEGNEELFQLELLARNIRCTVTRTFREMATVLIPSLEQVQNAIMIAVGNVCNCRHTGTTPPYITIIGAFLGPLTIGRLDSKLQFSSASPSLSPFHNAAQVFSIFKTCGCKNDCIFDACYGVTCLSFVDDDLHASFELPVSLQILQESGESLQISRVDGGLLFQYDDIAVAPNNCKLITSFSSNSLGDCEELSRLHLSDFPFALCFGPCVEIGSDEDGNFTAMGYGLKNKVLEIDITVDIFRCCDRKNDPMISILEEKLIECSERYDCIVRNPRQAAMMIWTNLFAGRLLFLNTVGRMTPFYFVSSPALRPMYEEIWRHIALHIRKNFDRHDIGHSSSPRLDPRDYDTPHFNDDMTLPQFKSCSNFYQ